MTGQVIQGKKHLKRQLIAFLQERGVFKRSVHNIPQIQVDGADVRNKLLGLEVKFTEVLDFKGTHLRTDQVLQEVVQHRDDPLSQEGVHKDPLDLWK